MEGIIMYATDMASSGVICMYMFREDYWRRLSNIKVVSEMWKAAMWVLLMVGVHDVLH
jgi:hypothetical protein